MMELRALLETVARLAAILHEGALSNEDRLEKYSQFASKCPLSGACVHIDPTHSREDVFASCVPQPVLFCMLVGVR